MCCCYLSLKPWYNEPWYSEQNPAPILRIYYAYYIWYSDLFDIVNKKDLIDLFAISKFERTTHIIVHRTRIICVGNVSQLLRDSFYNISTVSSHLLFEIIGWKIFGLGTIVSEIFRINVNWNNIHMWIPKDKMAFVHVYYLSTCSFSYNKFEWKWKW